MTKAQVKQALDQAAKNAKQAPWRRTFDIGMDRITIEEILKKLNSKV